MTTKICYTCKQEKDIEMFVGNSRSKDGHNNECKLCRCERLRIWRLATKRTAKSLTPIQKTVRDDNIILLPIGLRICNTCGLCLSTAEFYSNNDRLENWCKKCSIKERMARLGFNALEDDIKEHKDINRYLKPLGLKKCSDCGHIKPLNDFPFRDNGFNGIYRERCKNCNKIRYKK